MSSQTSLKHSILTVEHYSLGIHVSVQYTHEESYIHIRSFFDTNRKQLLHLELEHTSALSCKLITQLALQTHQACLTPTWLC